MVRVKICGITTWLDARAAFEAGAHALGFNFYPPSPRALAPAAAWEIRRRLPPFVEAVGVFVNWEANAVTSLCASLRLHAAQLHGDESPKVVAEVAQRIAAIKAFRAGNGLSLARFAKKLAQLPRIFLARPRFHSARDVHGVGPHGANRLGNVLGRQSTR